MAKNRSSRRTRLRILAALLLLVIVGGAIAWWQLIHWRPARGLYPVQGVEVSAEDGTVDFRALKAVGAEFVYIDASASAFARDAAFSRNLEQAREARLRFGAVHRYDPCQPGDKQAANFVTTVPRDATFLAPALELDKLAEDCAAPVSDAALESELTTFINQVEIHTGKPVLLKLSPGFERRYSVAKSIDRNLWLTNTRFEADYAGRPWALWTANEYLDVNIDGMGSVRWIAARP